MKCKKCEGEWFPPRNIKNVISNCPFCSAKLLDIENLRSCSSMGEFFKNIVSLLGDSIYMDKQKLINYISDLYPGDDKLKRIYKRLILDDNISSKIYNISLKPINERKAFFDKIVAETSEQNFFSIDTSKKLLTSFTEGLSLVIEEQISTKTSPEDDEWIDEYGAKYSADKKKLIKVPNCSSYTIKEGTIVICDKAFFSYYEISSFTSINIPNSVTTIGYEAFRWCENLTYINIPNSVTTIGNGAFRWCENLTSINISNTLTTIGDGAFRGCRNLTSINIPNSVINIGNLAFSECSRLTYINIPKGSYDKFCKLVDSSYHKLLKEMQM